MTRSVAIRNAHPRLRFPKKDVAKVVTILDHHAAKFLGGCPAGELSLIFLTDPALAKIHGDFMDDPTTTDVITFEGDPAAGLAGEICISVDTAMHYVEGPAPAGPMERKTKTRLAGTRALQDKFAAELTLYLVHGWLHLAGYDDLPPAKKRRMRAAEARAMKLLRTAKAIPAFSLH